DTAFSCIRTMRLIVISFYSGVIFVLQSNQETTFAYPLTQAWPSSCARAKSIIYCYLFTQSWPSSCSQTKRQLLLILLLRHSLRLAVKPRNNFCLSSYSGIAFVLRSGKAVLCLSSLMPLQLFTQANHFTNNG